MNILLTGASSFTGQWFARELAGAGHRVVATFTRCGASDYHEPLRAERVNLVAAVAEPLWNCRFGDERFVATLACNRFDVLCHHAADASDYKSPHFDVAQALARNTSNLHAVLDAMINSGCRRMVLTGSVFEGGEGCCARRGGGETEAGFESKAHALAHFSPYGLSKSLTSQTWQYYCGVRGVEFQKFVIPNPFGPLEEPRFTHYLVRSWRAGNTPAVRTPDYIRDNIHVDLLARCYVELVSAKSRELRMGPSGYVESQGEFAARFARQMQPRLGLECPLEICRQTDFPEPLVRFNGNPAAQIVPNWDETAAWDRLAEYYGMALAAAR